MAVDKEDDGGERPRPRPIADPHPNPNLNLNQPKARRGKSCKGVLYYDTLLKLQSKEPICYGVSESIPRVPNYIVGESELEASKEDRSLLDFKYSCTGYSVHFNNDDSSTGLADKRTELPFCIGLELLLDKTRNQASHHDLNHRRERDLPDGRPAKAFGLPPIQSNKPSPSPSPSPLPSPSTGDVYLDRFTRNAKLVAASMKKNLHRVANHIKRSIDDIVR